MLRSKILSILALICALSALSAKDSAPNILLFLTDDESAFDQRSYGFTQVPRPGFERVADHGILFLNAYSSAPSCGPARGSILTGRHFWQNEQMAIIQGFIPKEIPIFTDILREHGYEIANTGKRHGPAAAVEGSWKGEGVMGPSYMAEKMESVPDEIRLTDYAGNFEAFPTGYRGKASPYDYGVRVPLAIMWPEGIRNSGRMVEDFVSFADFAPTFLELAGIDIAAGMTGASLNSIFQSYDSGMVEGRDFMRTGMEWHGEFDPVSRSSRSIRKGSLTYLVLYENVDDEGKPLSNEVLARPVSEELYDLESDPWQMNNLANDPEHVDALDFMRRLYVESGHAMNDPRVTGEMDVFKQLRQYVQKRKKVGYRETVRWPLENDNL